MVSLNNGPLIFEGPLQQPKTYLCPYCNCFYGFIFSHTPLIPVYVLLINILLAIPTGMQNIVYLILVSKLP